MMANILPKTNISPENRPSLKETSIPTIIFSGAVAVSFRVLVSDVLLVNLGLKSYVTDLYGSEGQNLGRSYPNSPNRMAHNI